MSTIDARPWARTLDEDARRALDRFDTAIDAALEPYLDRLSGSEPRRGKAIHDLVWGFVEFTPGEIAMIDSPLVQRLRFIRQLGLAHLLFPAAGYSRFEHSLGSCFVIGRLFQSLHAHAIEDDVDPPSSLDLRLLRHAALLHDVGHCAFSHASERVWESPEFTCAPPRRWAEALASHLELQEKKPSIAEAMTVVALTSPASARLLEISLALDRVQTGILDWISDLARIVCGATLPGMRSGLASLMSGSMDADRMDYLARDSVVSGVNLTGDLRRLMTKMRLQPDGRRGTSTIVLEASGQQALSDLLLSREILTQRIYRHSKTIAAEGLLENALRLAARLHPSLLDPSTLFWLGDDVLLDRLSCSPSALEASEATSALQHLVRAILWRDLPKRALIARPRDLPPGEDRERLRSLFFSLLWVLSPIGPRILRGIPP
ncbi:MAG: HD domain-containing protein [Acidobacteria bacterium]|nr:HD domain-containing protein [Acidobacteriota bacterium]